MAASSSNLPADTGPDRIRVGISSCLLGAPVRYDGGHKHEPSLTASLARHFDLVSVCPEVEAGMGVPREPVELVSRGDGIHMVGKSSGTDHTVAMHRWRTQRIAELLGGGLCGFILKARSPSCGMADVHVHGTGEEPVPPGPGLFAEALIQAFPALPLTEEIHLREESRRDRFIEDVFAYSRREGATDRTT